MAKLPLEGIRVVDMTVVWAGPYATMFLADWGAEVIRVENLHVFQAATRGIMARPPSGTLGIGGWPNQYVDKEPGQRPWNRHPQFNAAGRHKLSMTVDLRLPEGVEIFKKLIAISDVFIENNVPETLDKLKIPYDDLKEVNPRLIMVRMPAYGLDGPYANYRSFGSQLECTIGHTSVRGYTDTDVASRGDVFTADAGGGVMAAISTLMALRYRNRTGKGQLIELSQAEAFISYLGQPVLEYTMNGRTPESWGNRHPFKAPHGCYPCRGEDKWITIAVGSNQEWQGLCTAMSKEALASDPRFEDSVSRQRNQDELDAAISEWTREQDLYEAFHLLQKHGVPAGPVLNEADAFQDPHMKERGFFQPITHPEAGTHLYPGPIWRMANTPNSLRSHPPLLGEHNEYVYKKLLSYSDQEYARLEAEGHIGMEYDEGL